MHATARKLDEGPWTPSTAASTPDTPSALSTATSQAAMKSIMQSIMTQHSHGHERHEQPEMPSSPSLRSDNGSGSGSQSGEEDGANTAAPAPAAAEPEMKSILKERPEQPTPVNSGAAGTNTNNNNKKKDVGCFRKIRLRWVSLMDQVRDQISKVILVTAVHAAMHPRKYVWGITLLTIVLVAIGFLTNFSYETQPDIGLAAKMSLTREQKDWIQHESNFPPQPHSLRIMLHNQGENVITQLGISKAFEIVDTLQNMPDYMQFCQEAADDNEYGYEGECHIRGVPLFWNFSRAIYEANITSNVDVMLAVSQTTFPDNSTVDEREIMGLVEYHRDVVVSAKSFLMSVSIPASFDEDENINMATRVLGAMLALRKEWATKGPSSTTDDNDNYRMEVYLTDYSLEMETIDAVFKDLPLIPMVFVMMTIFTIVIFSVQHKPGAKCCQPRMLMGTAAVVTICLSMGSAYGILFIIGTLLRLQCIVVCSSSKESSWESKYELEVIRKWTLDWFRGSGLVPCICVLL